MTEADFKKAAAVCSKSQQISQQSAQVGSGLEMTKPLVKQGVRQDGTILDKSRPNILMVATGFEPVTPSVSC